MPRHHRLLGLTTALVLSVSSLAVAGPSSAAAAPTEPAPFPTAAVDTPRSAVGVLGAPSRVSARSVWPVRQRTGTLTYHSVAPTGDLSQNFSTVTMVQDRLRGTVSARVTLGAAPTEETDAPLVVGFGKVVTGESGPYCQETDGSVIGPSHTYGTSSAYDGADLDFGLKLSAAKTQAWNCAFAVIYSLDAEGQIDGVHDAVTTDSLKEKRQQPALKIAIKGKKLQRRGFTKVPIKIHNSAQTIATAPAVRLSWKTKGARVKANKKVGTIKPGATKKGYFYVKKTRRGTSKVTFKVTSKTYSRSVTVKIRPL